MSTQAFWELVRKRGVLLAGYKEANKALPTNYMGVLLAEAAHGEFVYNPQADNRHRAYGFAMWDDGFFRTKHDFHSYRDSLVDLMLEHYAGIESSVEWAELRAEPTGLKGSQGWYVRERYIKGITSFMNGNANYSAVLRAVKDHLAQPESFFIGQVAEWLLELDGEQDYEYQWLKRLYENDGRVGNMLISDVVQLLKDAGAMVRPDNDRLYRIGQPLVQQRLSALTEPGTVLRMSA